MAEFPPRIRELLQPALDRGGTHRMQDIEAGVETGRFQLWVGPHCVGITEIVDFPLKRVLNIFLVGGDLEQIKGFQEEVWSWAEAQKCSEMTLSGRPGWSKALRDGWEVHDYLMRYKP